MWPVLLAGGVALIVLGMRRQGPDIFGEGDPVDGCPDGECVTSLYGARTSPITGASACHRGIDLGRPTGTAVRAFLDGVVTLARMTATGGNTVYIDHGDGIRSEYMHMSRLSVSPGDFVETGQKIGEVGSTGLSTGPHLHFGVKVDGFYVDPGRYLGLPEGRAC